MDGGYTPEPGDGALSGIRTPGSPVQQTSRKRLHKSSSDNEGPLKDRLKAPKVSRACDHCKSKKLRCSGTLPCATCSRRRLPCIYGAAYRRGRPPTPPPAFRLENESPATAQSGDITENVVSTPLRNNEHHLDEATRSEPLTADQVMVDGHPSTSRGSPEIEVAEIEGQYFDSTSSLSFLHRAWKKLSSQKATPHIFSGEEQHQSLTTAGDKPFTPQGRVVSLDRNETTELLQFYFNDCVVTYRCLHQGYVTEWLGTVLTNAEGSLPLYYGVGHARAAIVLTILAIATLRRSKIDATSMCYAEGPESRSDTYFCTATSFTDAETGLPKLESAQARLLQVLYLLQTSRMNHAWYVFGSILPIISALGLHRKSGRNRTSAGNGRNSRVDYIISQCGKRTFWVAYTIDKYLAVVLGRPRLYHEDDSDQDFPDSVNDEDMTPQGKADHEPQVDCHVDSLICHVKLAQLIDRTTREVYSLKSISKQERLTAARRCGEALHAWRESLPPHLGKVRPQSLIPSFRREATALKLAYCHAIMHANRPFLLGAISTPAEGGRPTPLDDSVEECLVAARAALETVDGMSRDGSLFYSLWWTPYVTFCALAVVYVWEIQNSRSHAAVDLFELAERCHNHLEVATAADSPSRRYGIILKELQQEARYQSSMLHGEQSGQPQRSANTAGPVAPVVVDPMDASLAATHGFDTGDPSLLASSLGGVGFVGQPRLLDAWQTTDWLDLDSSAFGPFPDFEGSSVFWDSADS